MYQYNFQIRAENLADMKALLKFLLNSIEAGDIEVPCSLSLAKINHPQPEQ